MEIGMKDNVFIFGAGSSFPAKIPLLSTFMDKLCEMSLAGNSNGKQLSEADLELLRKVMIIRNQLDGYHGRIKYDDRNIEDVLSLLSFNAVSGQRGASTDLSLFVKAISRVIENTCTVQHDGSLGSLNESGAQVYRDFWKAMFRRYELKRKIPSIITFNYDLVLERALMQVLNSVNTTRNGWRLPFDKVIIEYRFKHFPTTSYQVSTCTYRMDGNRQTPGIYMESSDDDQSSDRTLHIEILKLHGSQNFPRKYLKGISTHERLTVPNNDPYILPPVFNKISGQSPVSMWKRAHTLLRNCKNAIVVGYSMPTTDIYMQYFLKSGFGPNLDLNRVFVFDPILFQEDRLEDAEELIQRYQQCFSQQMHKRIVFRPYRSIAYRGGGLDGSFTHFVELLNRDGSEILF